MTYAEARETIRSWPNGGIVRTAGPFLLLGLLGGTSADARRIERVAASVGVRSIPVGKRPFGLAIAGDYAFVTELDNAWVARVRLVAPFRQAGGFATGNVPTGIAATPDGLLALVTNQHDQSVSLHRARTGALLRRFQMGGNSSRALFSRMGALAFATSVNGELQVIDVRAPHTATVIETGMGPINGIVEGPGDSLLYLTSVSGSLGVVDLRARRLLRSFDVDGRLQEVQASADGTSLYIADEAGRVIVVSPVTGEVTASAVVAGAFGLAVAPRGDRLWVTQPGAGQVTILALPSLSVVQRISFGGGRASVPRRIAFTSSGAAIVTDEAGFVHIVQ